MNLITLKGESILNITLNPQTLTTFAKWLVGAIGTAVTLYQVPAVHDAVAPILAAHPHVYSLIGAGIAIWGVLHNPVKP